MVRYIALFTICFLAAVAPAQSYEYLDDETRAKIDSVVNIQMPNLTGLGIGIVYKGTLAYTKGYGTANENGDPFTTVTQTVIASVSKIITAILAMQLVEAGDIDLDDPVSDYVSSSNFPGIT
ncbi:MAG: serine hydrolase domain-containing protein, partial [Saprospiraceae bacterium]|nr:serine hydrolase domain-containing protein [Saprospiraceae bacterium]